MKKMRGKNEIKKSETRMAASILKQDSNRIKGSKGCSFFDPSLKSLVVSADVKHHVYLLTNCYDKPQHANVCS